MKSDEELKYADYVREREHLSKYENDNYDNYQKTILTLSSAFLAFSVSFVALLRHQSVGSAIRPTLIAHEFLVWSWFLFASSVVVTLLSFLVNALGLRLEVKKLGAALENPAALKRNNPWTPTGYFLYTISGLMFAVGIVLLLMFATSNIVRL